MAGLHLPETHDFIHPHAQSEPFSEIDGFCGNRKRVIRKYPSAFAILSPNAHIQINITYVFS